MVGINLQVQESQKTPTPRDPHKDKLVKLPKEKDKENLEGSKGEAICHIQWTFKKING